MPLMVFPQMITIQARLDSTNILIGDQIKLNLFLTKSKDAQINFPILPDSLPGGLEIIERYKIDTLSSEGNNVKLRQEILITAFDSGMHVIHPIAFEYQHDNIIDTLFSDSIYLMVNTLPVDTTKQSIYDIKAPLDEPFSLMEIIEYILYGLGALLLIILGYFIYNKIRKKEPIIKIPQKPADPPHIIALRELDSLKEKKLWQNNQIKKYHSDLTEIIRKYIEDRFGIQALEMTSYEIIDAVSREKYIPENLHSELRFMLTLADMVKFAKGQPLPDENDTCMKNAYNFVNNTVPVQKLEAIDSSEVQKEGGNHA